MKQVRLAKAARYPIGSAIVHRTGDVIDVEDDDVAKLRELGVLADEANEPAESAQVVRPGTEAEPDTESEPVSGYPALPKKTAPVAEWKEYARRNKIRLTGLTKRNEIMGFVTKTVNESA